MSEALKPCPFCGGEARIGPDEHYPDHKVARCLKCGVYHFGSHLVERWNRRTPGPETARYAKALRSIIEQGRPDGLVILPEVEAAFLAEWDWPRKDNS